MNSKQLASLNRHAVTLSKAKSYTDTAVKNATGSGDVASHMNDTTIHITSEERTTWNSKAESDHTHDGVPTQALTNIEIEALLK